MPKRSARAQPAKTSGTDVNALEDQLAGVNNDLDFDEDTSVDESDSEADSTKGLAGLDAMIAASRHQRRQQATTPEPSSLGHRSPLPDATSSDAPSHSADDDDEKPPVPHSISEQLEGAQAQRLSRKVPANSLLRDEAFLANSGSDSSEDERPDRNTVGDVPLEWYKDEEHIGYDRDGNALAKRGKSGDLLDDVLRRNDTPGAALRTIYDPYNDEELTLSREELRVLMNIQRGKVPEVHINPYEDLVDWYSNDVDPTPMQNAPEPKRRFMPSKWEEKKIVKLVRALRRGWLKPKAERDAEAAPPPVYMLWDEDGTADTARTGAGLTYIPAPKPDLPGHEESYNPPAEYLPTAAERAAVEALDDEEKPAWVPRSFECLRKVPQYERIVHERFERCLDLYLCPRVRSKRINYKPEDLVPKELPSAADLRPFPNKLAVTYRGHRSKVRSVSCDTSGQWLLTGSDDGTVRLWQAATGHCRRVWDLGAKVHCVAWCPDPTLRLVSCVVENKVVLLASGLGGAAVAEAAAAALAVEEVPEGAAAPLAQWQKCDGGVEIVHRHQLRTVAWHARGDYFATVAPAGATASVAVHQLSTQSSQNPFRKNRGRVTCTSFHPTKPLFLVATENNVRIYNLAKQTLAKKLLAGGGVITSLCVHSSGDHVLIGTEDNRCLWFDLDLSTKPYKVMRYHEAAVRSVAYHKAYPLFASGSDDATVQVFHGMVYQDLMTNPLVVPVKILKGHKVHQFSGVMSVCFHPSQPWLFTGGGDGNACLYIDV